ncbi:MAG: ATP-binding protein [Gammaproteobacteria bacterium]|nr:ATP-binding protein [Gammaproteobacteria bacterium]MDE0273770.1 ATP-binding protein [Gammaproteobacteria bacterium]
MDFLDRQDELRRLDNALRRPGGFAVIWGRRRVGKSRLLLEWSKDRDGLYAVADQSAAPVQRRYMAEAVRERFPSFADVEYPDWRTFFERLANEARSANWQGPFIIDELPYLIVADPSITAVLQNWLDSPQQRPSLVVSGSSQRMMHGAILEAGAPLYGRASEAFALRPLRPGYLADAFGGCSPRQLVSAYALWGGMPRYWELAETFGADFDEAADALVLDPNGPLHEEPNRLLLAETPPMSGLRAVLDVIGGGVHRLSEIASRLNRPASSLSGPLATLVAMDLVRRETPFGSHPRSGKRSLYRIADPFMRQWFRVIAPHRALLAVAPRETRLAHWARHRTALEASAWEELCRLSVPTLHRCDLPLAQLGPWEGAQRHWRGNNPEFDVVARSVDGQRLLVGEAKWPANPYPASRAAPRPGVQALPGAAKAEIVHVLFTPQADAPIDKTTGVHIVDAKQVMAALR